MSAIKIILRPKIDRSLTINSPFIASNASSLNSKKNKIFKRINEFEEPQEKKFHSEMEYQFNFSPSSNSSRYKISSIKATDITNANEYSIKVIDLKIYIAKVMKIRPDMLNLYNFNNTYYEKFHLLQDSEPYNCYDTTEPIVLYYQISYEKQKVMVDIFQNSIDRIIFNLSPFCSIYMLKYLINQKIDEKKEKDNKYKSNNTTTNNNNNSNLIYKWKFQSIYGAGFIHRITKKLNRLTTNKKFEDTQTIENIINYCITNLHIDDTLANKTQENISFKDPEQILSLILIQSTNKKVIMGLDFSFNYLRNFIKIDFNEEAPSFREVSDGLNLIIYCKNEHCELSEKYFVSKEGYGTFNVLAKIKEIKCPKCGNSNIELRSLGIINARWVYKGIIQSKQDSRIEGDGFTLENNKFYALPEVKFINQFKILLIEVNFYHYYDKKNQKEKELNALDEVDLIIKEHNDITQQRWTLGNNNNQIETPNNLIDDGHIMKYEGRNNVCCIKCDNLGNHCLIC